MGALEGGIAGLANSPMAKQYMQAEADRANALLAGEVGGVGNLSPEALAGRASSLDAIARRHAAGRAQTPYGELGFKPQEMTRLDELIAFYGGGG